MSLSRVLDLGGVVALYGVLVWSPLAAGAYRGWPLATTELLALAGVLSWTLSMAYARRLEWRRTALDLPLALIVLVVLVQLALGNRALAAWALAPPPADPFSPAALPSLPLLGTASPAQTAKSLRLFATYAATYVLAVNLVRTRSALDRLVSV